MDSDFNTNFSCTSYFETLNENLAALTLMAFAEYHIVVSIPYTCIATFRKEFNRNDTDENPECVTDCLRQSNKIMINE